MSKYRTGKYISKGGHVYHVLEKENYFLYTIEHNGKKYEIDCFPPITEKFFERIKNEFVDQIIKIANENTIPKQA